MRRTKIVATLGPASETPEVIWRLIGAGMDVARINFSHGTHEEHARDIANLRSISHELDTPVTIIADLQGPKIRVGNLPGNALTLTADSIVTLLPEADFTGQPATIPLDYADLADVATTGMRVLLADGVFELKVIDVTGRGVRCRVIEGGVLNSRKGVNLPEVNLPLPSLTEKDKRDVEFGIAHEIDWFSMSFVRTAEDVRELKKFLATNGARIPVIAKIEKPQAVTHLDEILEEVSGVMVARGDLGVELSPEKVPMLQKQIIERCNQNGLPVITATQMLESMIHEPHPTRAEASDVANAIIDGTDAVMLSGESAIGEYPVRAIQMMERIACEVEAQTEFKKYAAKEANNSWALSEAVASIANIIKLRSIVVLTTSGHTARFVAAERTKTPVVAITRDARVYHALNLFWGIRPLLVETKPNTFEELVKQAESILRDRKLVNSGDKIVVIGGVPVGRPGGANFLKIHSIP